MKQNNKSFGKFMLLWSGGFISAIGSGLTSFGLGVYVYQVTGLASATAIVMLLAFLPTILLSAVAGVLADRYDRRLLMILGDGLSAVGLIFILICMLNGEASLWQICVGVTISSVFSSLLEPSYKATITDLLTKDQYTKASGLVQVSGSAKYLISPVLAGFLLQISDIKLLLVIDICTLFVTVLATLVVRRGLKAQISEDQSVSLAHSFREGWHAIALNKGVLALVWLGSIITFFLGFIQTLFGPLILSFADSVTLGTGESISASGMLVTSLLLGFVSIKQKYVKMLSFSLFFAGIFMALFGLRENIVLICVGGFMFFAMLPFANAGLDYLLRTNIDNNVQGRAWGLIGVISQLGYVAAYALSGPLADYVFTPLLMEGGALSSSVGLITGTGSGRGTGLLIIVAGLLLSVTSILIYRTRSIRALEQGAKYV